MRLYAHERRAAADGLADLVHAPPEALPLRLPREGECDVVGRARAVKWGVQP